MCLAGFDGRVGKVGEQTVNAKPEKLKVFLRRIAKIVRCEENRIVTEGIGMHDEAGAVCIVD